MPIALLAALLLHSDPVIEKVERLAGNVRRPLLWAPLAVTLSSGSGFHGDLVARSSFGVDFARPVRLAPGGRIRVLLPALDPVEVLAGGARTPVPADRSGAEVLVAVDARLAYAGELAGGDRVAFQRIDAGDLRELLPLGLLEAFDLLLLSETSGLPLGAMIVAGSCAVAPTRAEAERAVAALRPTHARIEALDRPSGGRPSLWDLAPRGGWVPAKRDMTLFFATVYAFAGFVTLVAAARRFPRFAWAGAGALSLVFVAAYLLFFPRGQVWVAETSCEVVPREGEAAEWRVWFLGAGVGTATRVEFPRLVKPVFAQARGADEPYTVRLEGRGCAVEGLRLGPARTACFAGVETRAPTARAAPALSVPIRLAWAMIGNRKLRLGDLPAGATPPAEVAEDGPPPRDTDFAAFGWRFVEGDCVFGWLDASDRPALDVRSPDLADARERPRFIVLRLK